MVKKYLLAIGFVIGLLIMLGGNQDGSPEELSFFVIKGIGLLLFVGCAIVLDRLETPKKNEESRSH